MNPRLRDFARKGGEAYALKMQRRRALLASLTGPLTSIEDAQTRLGQVIPEAILQKWLTSHEAQAINKSVELWLKAQTFAQDRRRVKELESVVADLERELLLRRAS